MKTRMMERLTVVGIVLIALGAGMVGCSEDMVDQPSYQAQEAPRRHSPPTSIPRDSRKVLPVLPAAFFGKEAHAAHLFGINCSHCHGSQGDGDGPVAGFLRELPKNLHSAHVQTKSEHEIYGIITEGHNLMPSFRGFLSAEERMLLAQYVKSLGRISNAAARQPSTDNARAAEAGPE
jgi:mono/diheme cytochrome c family protein